MPAWLAAIIVASGVASGAAGCAPVSAAGLGDGVTTPLKDIYQQWPSYESQMQGDFATGAMFADINGDGYPDLVVANGNDMSPQPLVIYLNHCNDHNSTCFGPYPDYYSSDSDYLGGIAIGDIDHDGWLDVAVSVVFDKNRHTSGGGVKIYHNLRGQLEVSPSQQLGHMGVFGCALADVNADGQLDLVFPGFGLPAGSGAPGPRLFTAPRRSWQPEPLQIHLNEGGRFAAKPTWQSSNEMFATGVAVADLDQDGWMDVAVAGIQTFVYRGGPPRQPGVVPIDPAPAWTSETDRAPAMFVDAGRIGDGKPLTLAVSRGCFPGDSHCRGDFVLYRPADGTAPVWRSVPADHSSLLLLADLNQDGLLDMVAGQWGDEIVGAPLWMFQGRRTGFHTEPDFATAAVRGFPSGLAVSEGLAVADTRKRATCPRSLRWVASAAGAVVTLPERQVAAVLGVEVGGQSLPATDWAFATGNNWISLAQPYTAGTTVNIRYLASSVQDLIEATWNPQRGNLLYNSFLTPVRCHGVAGSTPHQENQP
jgi:hypothetical protein